MEPFLICYTRSYEYVLGTPVEKCTSTFARAKNSRRVSVLQRGSVNIWPHIQSGKKQKDNGLTSQYPFMSSPSRLPWFPSTYTLSCQYVQTHAERYLALRMRKYTQTRSTRSAVDTCRHMHAHAPLFVQAHE
jgi:hypothetical protein